MAAVGPFAMLRHGVVAAVRGSTQASRALSGASAPMRATVTRSMPHRAISQGKRQLSAAASGPRTIYDKIWDDHMVYSTDDGTALLYIDR
eukprot:4200921-Pleurochrysis_carterae.AAC.2